MELSNKLMAVCRALDSKKAEDIGVIDISKNSSLADSFILATAGSAVHARTLSDAVVEAAESLGERVLGIDGHGQSNWISLDLGDVIVHIFVKEIRAQYSLEKLWGDSRNQKKFADIKKDIEKKEAASSKKVIEKTKKVTEKTTVDKKRKEVVEAEKKIKPSAVDVSAKKEVKKPAKDKNKSDKKVSDK